MSSFNPLQILRAQQQCPPTLRPACPGQPNGTSRGWHVKLLRRCLAAAGCYAGPKREELLDPATAVADVYDTGLAGVVKKYQERSGLKADGICGPKTWRHLAGWQDRESWAKPKDDALAIARTTAQGKHPEMVNARQIVLRAEFVRLARLELHVREQGHNRGAEVERILRQAEGQPGDAWCAAFCEALLEWACQNLGLPVPFEIGLSCSALVKRAEDEGRIVPPGGEQPGDMLVLKGGPTGHKHVGLIVELVPEPLTIPAKPPPSPPRQARTIEGNTNTAGSAEGDGVYPKDRRLDRKTCTVVRVV